MTSWFTGGASLGDTLLGLKDKVQSQVNNIDPNLLKKLTLQSDELVSERQRIDEEERRKEAVRETLSEILPWETRDEEMEILVEECKEVILNLSSIDETFTGPFVLPGGLVSNEDEGEVNDGDAEDEAADEDENSNRRAAEDLAAAEQSATKLSKLQPLPTLLADFDLDTHVGLIQRMLKVDPKLVGAHSRLSSGGQREVIFWKNYFFHCAYTRYEAGLSIDEIWSNEPRRPASRTTTPTTLKDDEPAEDFDFVQTAEQSDDGEIVFDSVSASAASADLRTDLVGATDVASDDAQRPIGAGAATTSKTFTSDSPPSTPQRDVTYKRSSIANSDSDVELLGSGGTDYEFVASDDAGEDGDDGSIDELEAEIAAALGD
ncbi:hypothetical protein ACHAWU_008381 [Discostella pseudostelligera]|uniref:BSD domain-containing protein n=1 Tax=Discostella pseudostelligera TaxID=259834 RepID=A0ABD3M4T0_9STRA